MLTSSLISEIRNAKRFYFSELTQEDLSKERKEEKEDPRGRGKEKDPSKESLLLSLLSLPFLPMVVHSFSQTSPKTLLILILVLIFSFSKKFCEPRYSGLIFTNERTEA